MPRTGRPVYREHTPWPGWIHLVIWSTLGMSLLLIMGSEVGKERTVGVAVILGVGLSVQWLLAGLDVRLYPDVIRVGLGNGRLIRGTIRYDDIERLEVVRYSPLADFGGWGYRWRGHKRAWTSRGDEAVVLSMKDGKQIYIGSDRPDRLKERIATIGGTRIGGGGA